MMNNFKKSLLTAAITLASTQAMAAGFQLNSQSAAGIGRAFAGDAVIADNASVLSRNPAAMAMFDNKSLSIGVSYADLEAKVSNVHVEHVLGNVEYGSIDNAAADKFIPNFYYIHPINDKFAFGLAAFSNFGTGTDATELASPVEHPVMGTLPAPVDILGNTSVTTINFNASVSYRINEQLSVGAGIDMVYGEGELTRSGELPVGPNGEFYPVDLVTVDADGVAFGGILGITYEINADHRLGASYRFSPEFEADGTVNLAGNDFDQVNIPLPDIFQVAGFHQLSDQFALHYTAQLTRWGDFDEITVSGPVETTLKEYYWKDSWLYSLGGTYTINDNWAVRAGYMYDNGVVDQLSSISIPDSTRNWYTAGVSYYINNNASIDFGIASVQGEEVGVAEASQVTAQFPLDPRAGTVLATTDSNAMYYSLQYNHTF